MKKIVAAFIAIASAVCFNSTLSLAASPKVSAEKVSAKPGETVEVKIALSDNPGFAYMGVEIGYDSSVMSLTKVENNTAVGGGFTGSQNLGVNPYCLQWDNYENLYYNGTLATMTFTVNDDAAPGVYDITVDYYKGPRGTFVDGVSVNFDEDEEPIGLTYANGSITVTVEEPLITVESEGAASTRTRTDDTFDKVYTYTVTVPQNVAITSDDITVTINGVVATKSKNFAETIGTLSGGDAQFKAAITKIPKDAVLSEIKCAVSIKYMLDDSLKTETTEFTLE